MCGGPDASGEADRQVANTLADLIIGGVLVTEVDDQGAEVPGDGLMGTARTAVGLGILCGE